MSKLLSLLILLFLSLISGIAQPPAFKNYWTNPPLHIPNDVSVDAPLMGNGDVTMSVAMFQTGFGFISLKTISGG